MQSCTSRPLQRYQVVDREAVEPSAWFLEPIFVVAVASCERERVELVALL